MDATLVPMKTNRLRSSAICAGRRGLDRRREPSDGPAVHPHHGLNTRCGSRPPIRRILDPVLETIEWRFGQRQHLFFLARLVGREIEDRDSIVNDDPDRGTECRGDIDRRLPVF